LPGCFTYTDNAEGIYQRAFKVQLVGAGGCDARLGVLRQRECVIPMDCQGSSNRTALDHAWI
jgi:hypothetical protein